MKTYLFKKIGGYTVGFNGPFSYMTICHHGSNMSFLGDQDGFLSDLARNVRGQCVFNTQTRALLLATTRGRKDRSCALFSMGSTRAFEEGRLISTRKGTVNVRDLDVGKRLFRTLGTITIDRTIKMFFLSFLGDLDGKRSMSIFVISDRGTSGTNLFIGDISGRVNNGFALLVKLSSVGLGTFFFRTRGQLVSKKVLGYNDRSSSFTLTMIFHGPMCNNIIEFHDAQNGRGFLLNTKRDRNSLLFHVIGRLLDLWSGKIPTYEVSTGLTRDVNANICDNLTGLDDEYVVGVGRVFLSGTQGAIGV